MTSLSPAERYAASRTRRGSPRLEAFRQGLPYDLDPFQLAACQTLEEGRSVLVAAPTGAGSSELSVTITYSVAFSALIGICRSSSSCRSASAGRPSVVR